MNDRDYAVIRYAQDWPRLTTPLWIDAETRLPLKRERGIPGELPATLDERYSDYELNVAWPADTFTLPD